MNEASTFFLVALIGAACGIAFFGGLWWTIVHGLHSRQAAIWFLASGLIRSGAVLAVFFWIGHGEWFRMLACAAGFLASRIVIGLCGRWPTPQTRSTPST